tara:strand:+ start:1158 stop:1535 length:378 start_codon:yes stop_codon:yes gene_type:complete
MKSFILIILLLLGGVSYSQDTLQIPQDELNNFFEALDTIRHQDSLKTSLINDLESQIDNYTALSKKDSLIINYKVEEIRLLNEQILLYNIRISDLNVWYRRPWVGYIAGTVSTILTVHLINYTLP